MSAPVIPNLNTLRRGGGRNRGRGRGAAFGEAGETSHETNLNWKDRIVQNTDNDAATSRLSAVEAGYLEDPFAKLLTHNEAVDRRLPLMNRGTYVRTAAIDHLVDDFLTSSPTGARQIISLGAGSDTRFFRLKHKHPDLHLIYHEIDFPSNTTAKIRQMRTPTFIETAKRLCNISIPLPSKAAGDEDEITALHLTAHNSQYNLHALDLRTLSTSTSSTPEEEWQYRESISPATPTLILSECCLIYLSPESATSVLHCFTSNTSPLFQPSTPLGVIIYEPIRPHDPFGRRMVSNLTARGIQLQTLETYDGLGKQRRRLREALGLGDKEEDGKGAGKGSVGGEGDNNPYRVVAGDVGAADIEFIWRNWVEASERERVEGLEWMDEVEEWELLARHYCVAWGWREGQEQAQGGGEEVFEQWNRLPVQQAEE